MSAQSNHHSNGDLGNYQRGTMNRSYNGCDQCHKDRKKCEGGVPCSRCERTRKTCTSQGVSQRDDLNTFIMQTYGPGCLFARYINKDGYYIIYSPNDGFCYMQSLSNFCEPVGPPQRICPDDHLDVRNVPYNVEFTVDDLFNGGSSRA